MESALSKVADLDLEIRGGGHPDREISGGPGLQIPNCLKPLFQSEAKCEVIDMRSALFNICRKALGHLMKFTQRSIPAYRFGLAG